LQRNKALIEQIDIISRSLVAPDSFPLASNAWQREQRRNVVVLCDTHISPSLVFGNGHTRFSENAL
jgi:hypothetical protein